MGADLLQVVVEDYRENGPMAHGVPASQFLASGDATDVEQALAILLDNSALAGRPGGILVLAPRLRLAVLTRQVLERWVSSARNYEELAKHALLDSVRGELRSLVAYAVSTPVVPDLRQRAAELAGVLLMSTLDAEAMDVVAGHSTAPGSRLQQLASLPAGSCRSPKELLVALGRSVTTRMVELA